VEQLKDSSLETLRERESKSFCYLFSQNSGIVFKEFLKSFYLNLKE
jgi:hypothetical protein